VDATFWAIDPPDNGAGARHLRIELTVAAGQTAVLDEIGTVVGSGQYPLFLTERLETHRGELRVRS
jgi:hypothetical protein